MISLLGNLYLNNKKDKKNTKYENSGTLNCNG